jgi:hypothetical protein
LPPVLSHVVPHGFEGHVPGAQYEHCRLVVHAPQYDQVACAGFALVVGQCAVPSHALVVHGSAGHVPVAQ